MANAITLSIIHLNYLRRSLLTKISSSLKTIRTEQAISRLLNNITFNLPRLVDVMIAPSDNLLLIILSVARSALAYVYVRQALTTKLTTNWNIARAHNQRKNYLTAVVMLESVQEYLNFPFLVVSVLPYSLFHRSIRHRHLHRTNWSHSRRITQQLDYPADRRPGKLRAINCCKI